MITLGLVGWRGMVGSVLLERLLAEGDLHQAVTTLFSTSLGLRSSHEELALSHPGLGIPPNLEPIIANASDIDSLRRMQVIISCQGGQYTSAVYPPLRAAGWQGVWIDAASTLRLDQEALIILDPINGERLRAGLRSGIRTFAGGNCTVSLLLLALHGLLAEELIGWVATASYQAVSGAGAKQVLELIDQYRFTLTDSATSSALLAMGCISSLWRQTDLPTSAIGAPLAWSLLPFIDALLPSGQSREEWKAEVEANRILDTKERLAIDGTCVRVPVLRCHSQALTIGLRQPLTIEEIEYKLSQANDWVKVIPNNREATLSQLTPAAISGTLDIAIGRLRHLSVGPNVISAFTVGDQLLWGAAEPLRRMLRIVLDGGYVA